MNRPRTLLLALALAASAAPSFAQPKPAPPISDAAKQYFKAGVDFLHDPDGARYEDAYRSFKLAYAATPSWKILGNLGLSAMKLERVGEAIDAYEKYLAESGSEIDAAERAQIERDLRLLKASAATVALTAGPADVNVTDERQRANGTMAVNGYVIPAGKTITVLMQAGRHAMLARHGAAEERWDVELTAGTTTRRTFGAAPTAGVASTAAPGPTPPKPSAQPPADPPPVEPAPHKSTLKTAGVITMGVGGAMILGGVITGLMGKSKLSQLESDCPNKRCTADKQGDADSIASLQTTTNVLWIGGAVVAGAGAAMFFVGKKQEQQQGRFVRVAPTASQGGAGLVAVGRF